jgi:hypothetical protein
MRELAFFGGLFKWWCLDMLQPTGREVSNTGYDVGACICHLLDAVTGTAPDVAVLAVLALAHACGDSQAQVGALVSSQAADYQAAVTGLNGSFHGLSFLFEKITPPQDGLARLKPLDLAGPALVAVVVLEVGTGQADATVIRRVAVS